MAALVDIYCDESCHLESNVDNVMALGAIWCPHNTHWALARKIKKLKQQHGLAASFEIKWVKVSPGKLDFYLDLIRFFFAEPTIHFRGIVVPDKSRLDHAKFSQTHDEFYYKMWFVLLSRLLSDTERFHIYIDIKDTNGQLKVNKLHEVLCNSKYDFDREILERVQQVRSNEVLLLQLTDLITGAIAYAHRGLTTSKAKLAVIEEIRTGSGYSLLQTTLLREEKLNLLVWNAQELV